MLNCEQAKGQSVYQHGLSVRDHFNKLRDVSFDLWDDEKWRLPTWYTTYQEEIIVNLYDQKITDLYTLYHDCGKPYCLTIDEQGKRHFPDHADASARVWQGISSELTETNREKGAVFDLIHDDMVIHTATANEIDNHLKNNWTKKTALTLLIAALAEVHSNANMFGGIQSTSFKMKWRKIKKRGNQICKFYFGEKKCTQK
jgi:hypothetical protein